MSTQFIEFIAPFPQVETLQMPEGVYEYPCIPTPDPEIISLSGGFMAMLLDLPDDFINDNKFNVIEGFKLFKNTKRYIQTKHDEFLADTLPGTTGTSSLHALINHAGLQNSNDPGITLDQWKDLKGMIHRKYFEAIGIDPYVLNMMLEADAQEYMDILSSSIVISCFVVRYMSCMYEGRIIPKLDEWQAINYIRAFQQKMPFRCCINIRDVKSIFVELDNTVIYRYCHPEFRIEGDFFSFSGDNRDNTVVRSKEIDVDISDLL